jgi:transcriptional regulator GlxA family with amidase domain
MTVDVTFEQLARAVAGFPRRTLGALVFPGFQALDLWGPLEVFGDCAPAVRPILIGVEAGPHPSAQGPAAVADFGLQDPVRPDLILVPGGNVADHVGNHSLLQWIRDRSADAELVMSVCNGAELLAAAGVLDGRRATTNKRLFRGIAAAHPRVQWVARARWVEDGRFVTSSGVSAGIDMAFAVVARFAGPMLADALATRIEYERHRDPGWDPFAAAHDLG